MNVKNLNPIVKMTHNIRLLILFCFFSTNIFGQDYCAFFLPNYKYEGEKKIEIKIEIKDILGKKAIVVWPYERGGSYKFGKNDIIQIFFSNNTKIEFSIKETIEKGSIEDRRYRFFLSPAQEIQVRSGIIGFILIEPFPGEIVGFKFIGNCESN